MLFPIYFRAREFDRVISKPKKLSDVQSQVSHVSFHCPLPVQMIFFSAYPSSKRRSSRHRYLTTAAYGNGPVTIGNCTPCKTAGGASQNTSDSGKEININSSPRTNVGQ
jgi:hypothetical protein